MGRYKCVTNRAKIEKNFQKTVLYLYGKALSLFFLALNRRIHYLPNRQNSHKIGLSKSVKRSIYASARFF